MRTGKASSLASLPTPFPQALRRWLTPKHRGFHHRTPGCSKPFTKRPPCGQVRAPTGSRANATAQTRFLQADTPWGRSCTDLHWLGRRNFCCRPDYTKDQVWGAAHKLRSLVSARFPPAPCHPHGPGFSQEQGDLSRLPVHGPTTHTEPRTHKDLCLVSHSTVSVLYA